MSSSTASLPNSEAESFTGAETHYFSGLGSKPQGFSLQPRAGAIDPRSHAAITYVGGIRAQSSHLLSKHLTPGLSRPPHLLSHVFPHLSQRTGVGLTL